MTDAPLPFTAAAFHRLLNQRRLMGSRCRACQALYLPPRALCPQCHNEEMEWAELSGKARLAAFTSVFIGPTFMNNAGFSRTNPYVTGIAELEEGVMISARILDVDAHNPATIQIGTPLTVDYLEQVEGEDKKIILAFRAAS